MSKYDEVLQPFMAMMDAELHANAAKGDRPGWLGMTAEQCLLEIYYHVAKLQKAVRDSDGDRIKENTADVANMAMMLADICGALVMAPKPAAEETLVMDLEKLSWEMIRESAAASSWIPPEYTGNDWVADVCRFLRDGGPDQPFDKPFTRYTCKGKGGKYEYLGFATGAGAIGGSGFEIYRSQITLKLYARTIDDFAERMERLS